ASLEAEREWGDGSLGPGQDVLQGLPWRRQHYHCLMDLIGLVDHLDQVPSPEACRHREREIDQPDNRICCRFACGGLAGGHRNREASDHAQLVMWPAIGTRYKAQRHIMPRSQVKDRLLLSVRRKDVWAACKVQRREEIR